MSGFEVIGVIVSAIPIVTKVVKHFGTPRNAPRQVDRLSRMLAELQDARLLQNAMPTEQKHIHDMVNRCTDILEKETTSQKSRAWKFFWSADAEARLKEQNDELEGELDRLQRRVHMFTSSTPPLTVNPPTHETRAPPPPYLEPSITSSPSPPSPTSPIPRRGSASNVNLPTILRLETPYGKRIGEKLQLQALTIIERDDMWRRIQYLGHSAGGIQVRITHRIPRGNIWFEDEDLEDRRVSFLEAHDITIQNAEGYKVYRAHSIYEFSSVAHREQFLVHVRERQLLGRFFAEKIWERGDLIAQQKVIRLWKKRVGETQKTTLAFIKRDEKPYERPLVDFCRRPTLRGNRVDLIDVAGGSQTTIECRPPAARPKRRSGIFGARVGASKSPTPEDAAPAEPDAAAFKAAFEAAHPATWTFTPLELNNAVSEPVDFHEVTAAAGSPSPLLPGLVLSPSRAPTVSTLSIPSAYFSSPEDPTVSHGGGRCLLGTADESDENRVAAVGSSEVMTLDSDGDTRSVYSDTMSLRNTRINDYVAAFANEICDSLPANFSREDLDCMADNLPAVLEGFAGRVGYQATGKLQRQIKYIAHRYRVQIVHLIRRRLSRECKSEAGDEENENPDSPVGPETEIDNQDKIRGWLAAGAGTCTGGVRNHEDTQVPDLDWLSESEDEIEDPLWHDDELPNIAGYREVLQHSPAYRWLLSSFETQRELIVPGQQPCIRSQISRSIVGKLRSGKRFSYSSEVCVCFKLDWDIIDFHQTQQYQASIGDVIERAVTLTGHGNDVQILTCMEYMRQTWPETGPSLLTSLQAACEASINTGNTWKGTLAGETSICASFGQRGTDFSFDVRLTGNAFAVAEAGEQLAWLGAALRSASAEDRPMSSTPYIRYFRVRTPPFARRDRRSVVREGICEIGFRLAEVDVDPSVDGSCWRGLFRNPAIVSGYPVRSRQSTGSGAQVPLDIAGALINTNRFVKWAGTTFIKGFSALLAATKVVGDTVLWHLVYNEDGSYISYEDSRVPRWPVSADPFVLESMAHHRHVVGWCDKIISHAGAPNANYAVEWSGLPGPDQRCALEKVTISGGQFINVGLSCLLGLKDKPVHINFGENYYGMLDNIADRHFVFFDPGSEDRRGWLLDGASAVLHLLRASIKNYREGRLRTILCSPDSIELDEGSFGNTHAIPGSRGQAAFEILSNSDNVAIPLYPLRTKVSRVQTAALGIRVESAVREETTYFTIGDRIDQICQVLCQVTAHHDDVQTQSGVGFRLRSTPRRQLEGFDFKDIAAGQSPLRPKVVMLKAKGLGWVDFTRSLHAPTLFGCGFGDLFSPFPSSVGNNNNTSCSTCSWNKPIPTGRDHLAATVSDMLAILRRQGNKGLKPWRLVDNVHWYTPHLTTGPCSAAAASNSRGPPPETCDRVQVLLPSSFPKLWGRASPGVLAADGAVMFGHSTKFPLRYGERRESVPEVGDPGEDDEDSLGVPVGSSVDSGIGTSLRSSVYSQQGGCSSTEGGAGGTGTPPKLGLDEGRSVSGADTSWNPERIPGKGSSSGSPAPASRSGLYRMPNERFVTCAQRHVEGLADEDQENVRGTPTKRGRGYRPSDTSEGE